MAGLVERAHSVWHESVLPHAGDIDPSQEYIWRGVLIGFLLGFGLSLQQAERALNEMEWEY